MSADRLDNMFELRKQFMIALSESRKDAAVSSGEPLDLSKRDAQRHLRDVALRGVEEVFESLLCLKSWKPHRETYDPEFDREKFLEEWVDAFNYFFSVLILAGFTSQDVYRMYLQKDQIIHKRLKDGY